MTTYVIIASLRKLCNCFAKRATIFICTLFLLCITTFGQQKITGVITGVDHTPLFSATVTVKNRNSATTTDANGYFSIEAKTGDALIVSYVGYMTKEIKLGNETSLKISLYESIANLDEIIVTGYSSQKIKEITGSIAVVKPKDLTAVPAAQVEQMLQGRVAGLTVLSSGEPGAPVNVRLHGIGNFGDVTPLYITDGVEGNINNINPYDIESLQVLKDAGTYSIYGVRGANGVIVVTTKRGINGKTRISYDGYVGLQEPLKHGIDLLNPQEQANLIWTALKNSNDTGANGNPDYPPYGNGPTPCFT